jgi:hypothetical protein
MAAGCAPHPIMNGTGPESGAAQEGRHRSHSGPG